MAIFFRWFREQLLAWIKGVTITTRHVVHRVRFCNRHNTGYFLSMHYREAIVIYGNFHTILHRSTTRGYVKEKKNCIPIMAGK